MRCYLVVCIAGALLISGCRSGKKSEAALGKTPPVRTETARPKAPTPAVNAVRGRVASVRDDLRFLIVDFAGSKLPILDQTLSVYRLDQKVAEIKVSGPYRGTTAAADITAGDVRAGDLVRDR